MYYRFGVEAKVIRLEGDWGLGLLVLELRVIEVWDVKRFRIPSFGSRDSRRRIRRSGGRKEIQGVGATVLAKCDILVSPWALGGGLPPPPPVL